MDLHRLRTFVAAYEEASFSKAAIRLNATQPGVSSHIALLEEELENSLFERAGRGVRPTIAGRRLYARASQIIQDVDRAAQEIKGLSGLLTGEVAVGIPPTLSRAILAPVLSAYVASFPNVDVRVFEAYSDTLLSLTESGELDFAVVAQLMDHPAIEYRKIYQDHFVVASGVKLGLEKHSPVRLDIEPYFKLVVPSLLRRGLQRLLEEPLRTRRIVPARVIEIDGLAGALDFLAVTDWIALLPAAAAYNNPEGVRIQFNRIASEPILIDYFIAHARTKSLSVAARAFIDLTVTELERVAAHSQSAAHWLSDGQS
jgi:LysR family nitrogen assimilation transcriptional regulator